MKMTPNINDSTMKYPVRPIPLHIDIQENEWGFALKDLIYPYIQGATKITIYDPYIREGYQIKNLVALLERALDEEGLVGVLLVTNPVFPDMDKHIEWVNRMEKLRRSLTMREVQFEVSIDPTLHDRRIVMDSGWVVIPGRGLDTYKFNDYFEIGATDERYRLWHATKIDTLFIPELDEIGYAEKYPENKTVQ